MARETIFATPQAPRDGDYERGCCKTSQDQSESRDAPLPGHRKNPEMSVRNVERPRFGKGY